MLQFILHLFSECGENVETLIVENDTSKGVIFLESILEATTTEDEAVVMLSGDDIDGK